MKKFVFKVTVEGTGKTLADAWENVEFGDILYDDFQEICYECNEDINECSCVKSDSGDILSESWFDKADDKTERENG